jgi:hypothetical protein
MSLCRVDCLTQDDGILLPGQAGLECAVQAVRMRVSFDGDGRRHAISEHGEQA